MGACVIEKSITVLQRFVVDGFGPTMEQEAEFWHSILNREILDFGPLRLID